MNRRTTRVIDFRPAPPGWRVLYLNAPIEEGANPLQEEVMAGWLVVEYAYLDDEGNASEGGAWEGAPNVKPRNRERAIVAGVVDEFHGVSIASEYVGIWKIVEPGGLLPTDAEIATELADRALHEERMAAARAARAEREKRAES